MVWRYTNMISVAEALERIAAQAAALEIEAVDLESARGRILAADVRSGVDLPPFSNSAMDGYALHARETGSASEQSPVTLMVTDTIAAGSPRAPEVGYQAAIRIMTGAPLPGGADAVLQLEHARLRDESIEIRAPVAPGRHVRVQGEDVRAGDLLAARGSRLTTNLLGLLASAGIVDVAVHRRARVAIIATGRELVQPATGAVLGPGQIFDSNGAVMRAMAADAGCSVRDLGTVEDDPDLIRARIEQGIDDDLIMISGGVSVGKHDHVKRVLADLGMERLFWRVRMKPGKPLLCGRIGSTWIFGLPGNPISCVAGFVMFIEPLLRTMHGHLHCAPLLCKARLTRAISHDASRQLLATARISRTSDGLLEVAATDRQGSAMMHTLADSNGFLIVPENVSKLERGELVDVLCPE